MCYLVKKIADVNYFDDKGNLIKTDKNVIDYLYNSKYNGKHYIGCRHSSYEKKNI